MCGLCGVLSTRLSPQEIASFQHLMTVSTLRGSDGAGFVAAPVKADREFKIVRQPHWTAADLVYSHEFWDIALKDTNKPSNQLSMLMGHARMPTTGGTDEEDCHPHIAQHIVGMHNGTLTKVGRKVTVKDNDSRMLFDGIATVGIQKTFQETEGSFAVTFIDKKSDTLYFARNKQRPLYWGKIKAHNTIWWASESVFLEMVLGRLFTGQELKIYQAKPDTLVSFRVHPLGMVGYVDAVPLDTPASHSVPEVKSETQETKGNNSHGMVETARGKFVALDELKLKLQEGCAYCGKGQTLQDHLKHKLTWTGVDEFICEDCVKYDEFARDYCTSRGIVLPARSAH